MDVQPVKLKKVLAAMNEKDHLGRPVPFQVAFHTASNKLSKYKRVALGEAVRCGLPRQHQGVEHLIGIQPKLKGKHTYSVHIRLITEFNNQPVVP
jgi:hypothetical protein